MANLGLGFALIPDKHGIAYVCELNNRINQRYPSGFVLKDGKSLLPHVSLYQVTFQDQQLGYIQNAFDSLREKTDGKIVVRPVGINIWATKIFF